VRGWSVLYRRALAGFFFARLVWLLFCLALFYHAFFFLLALNGLGGEVNRALGFMLGGGGSFWVLMVILPPLLTMRMISEESRSGVLEFLLTAPVSDAAVVLGKALAAATVLAAILLTVPLYGLIVHALGAPPDWGQLLLAYLGAVLVSFLFTSVGIVASACSGTPLVAAFFAMVLNIIFLAAPMAGAPAGPLGEALGWGLEKINVMSHFQGSFLTGAFDTAHFTFFVAWIAALLFLAVRLVETRRWLG